MFSRDLQYVTVVYIYIYHLSELNVSEGSLQAIATSFFFYFGLCHARR